MLSGFWTTPSDAWVMSRAPTCTGCSLALWLFSWPHIWYFKNLICPFIWGWGGESYSAIGFLPAEDHVRCQRLELGWPHTRQIAFFTVLSLFLPLIGHFKLRTSICLLHICMLCEIITVSLVLFIVMYIVEFILLFLGGGTPNNDLGYFWLFTLEFLLYRFLPFGCLHFLVVSFCCV